MSDAILRCDNPDAGSDRSGRGERVTDLNIIFDLRRDQNESPTLIPLSNVFRLKFESSLTELKKEYRLSKDPSLKERIEALDSAFKELQDKRADIVWELGYSITPDQNLTIDEKSAFDRLKEAYYILRENPDGC
jgi:hypothetical protein